MALRFFATPAAWRDWLEKYHGQRQELLVGFYKKDSGRPSITWPESVDAALCFGWIDGVRRRIDDVSYSIRFTPRKPRSAWSAVNIKRVGELTSQGLMCSAGIQAFEARQEERSRIYSFEQESVEFESAQERRFRANGTAWKFFRSQPPWYRRAATWWVISAKREETREKRLATVIEDSEQSRTIRHLTRISRPS
ncbi:MAG: hypothetical protein JWO80_4127 [Bryobacterales bacterium]|nr:hypothetical protein [Bryobacterales bacterium]